MENNQGSSEVSLKEAFLYWFKLGFINFGGPAGQIAMLLDSQQLLQVLLLHWKRQYACYE